MRNISRKTGNGDDQSSMDIKLACNLSDRETPSSDSVEMQGTVVPGESTSRFFFTSLSSRVVLMIYFYSYWAYKHEERRAPWNTT